MVGDSLRESPLARRRISVTAAGAKPSDGAARKRTASRSGGSSPPTGARPREPLQQAHRLEELEAVRLPLQFPDQTRPRSPVRGGHRRSSPSRPLMRAVSLVKELMEQ